MYRYLMFFTVFIAAKANAQWSVKIGDFSDKHYAVVTSNKYYEEGTAEGKIRLYDKDSERLLIEADITAYSANGDSTMSFNGDIVKHHEDYNFDGVTDIALYR